MVSWKQGKDIEYLETITDSFPEALRGSYMTMHRRRAHSSYLVIMDQISLNLYL
jgi:hypothetical protein